MAQEQCNGIFISHASEDKEKVVEPFINCLQKEGISNIWYDKDQIEEGHSIIEKINGGLKNSKIGIVIITPDFIRKPFTNWELACLTYLTIYNEIRLIPLFKNISREEIRKKYRLLAPLHFKEILNECDPDLIEHIRNHLEVGDSVIDNPNNQAIVIQEDPNKKTKVIKTLTLKFNITTIDDINRDTIAVIYDKIQTSSPEIKELNITKILTFASKRRIWIHKETWDIIKYLINSQNMGDIKNGVYILGEMVKNAKLENEEYVSKNVEELFFFKLLDLSDPLNDKNISHYTLDVLEIILESDIFFDICISVLLKAMEDIKDNSHYTNYIQFFFNKINKYKNHKNIALLIDRLENLIQVTNKVIAKERATDFANLIIKDYQHLL